VANIGDQSGDEQLHQQTMRQLHPASAKSKKCSEDF
jgi:hypothetical protein